jgi:hypothetical protein
MRCLFVAFSAVLVSLSAHASPAAAVHDCGPLDSIGNLIGNVRSFGNGAIRVAYISTEEPVAASDHLLIFVAEEPMGAGCYAISANAEGRGFGQIDIDGLTGSYDPNEGLLLSVPVSTYDPDKAVLLPVGHLKVRISRNNNSNSVTIEK